MPCAFATRSASREGVDITLGDRQPPYNPPDLPHCASDPKVPRGHKDAMRSEYAHLREDPTGREFYRLLDAETFELVQQPAINAMWVFDWEADEYGWPTKTKSRLVAWGDEQYLFGPSVADSTVRLLTAMVCELDLDMCHSNIEQTFVQSVLEESILMRLG